MYKGNKVILREMRSSDMDEVMKYVNDYGVYSSFTDSVPLPKTEEMQKKWLANSINPRIITFAVELIDTGEFIGTCQLRAIDMANGNAYLSIIIGKASVHGQGYGYDTVKTLLAFAFRELNLHKVSLAVYANNPGAIRLYEKAGFVREGTLKQEVYRQGRYCDQFCYSILSREFLGGETQ